MVKLKLTLSGSRFLLRMWLPYDIHLLPLLTVKWGHTASIWMISCLTSQVFWFGSYWLNINELHKPQWNKNLWCFMTLSKKRLKIEIVCLSACMKHSLIKGPTSFLAAHVVNRYSEMWGAKQWWGATCAHCHACPKNVKIHSTHHLNPPVHVHQSNWSSTITLKAHVQREVRMCGDLGNRSISSTRWCNTSRCPL